MKPKDFHEALALIRSEFPEDQLSDWAALPLNEALTRGHFSLGQWIRNSWIYPGDCPLVDLSTNQFFFISPDDTSSYIMEVIWHMLNDKTTPTIPSNKSIQRPPYQSS